MTAWDTFLFILALLFLVPVATLLITAALSNLMLHKTQRAKTRINVIQMHEKRESPSYAAD